jgi:rRNA maturation RNase YbeY
MSLEINNVTKSKIDEKELLRLFKRAINVLKLKSVGVSLAFISELEIKKLNKIYRGKNKVTDVLSFGSRDINELLFSKFPEEKDFLGEIVICPKFAATKSKLFNLSNEMMLNKLFVHGLVHLVGYDHEKSEKEAVEMEKLEEKILNRD